MGAVVSRRLKLGVEGALLTAATRASAQLFILANVLLVPIFNAGNGWIVLCYLFLMILVAAREATVRPSYTYPSMFFDFWACILLAVSMVLTFAIVFVLRPSPWFEPQYLIPVGGMLIGNSINGLSLALGAFLRMTKEQQEVLELRLALGATKWEAVLPFVRSSLEAGLTSNLNQMATTGIVSIPGMMTGQILGGQPPAEVKLICCPLQVLADGQTRAILPH